MIISSGNENKEVRALLDLCSQRTFILSSVAKSLRMTPVKKIKLAIHGFCGKVESQN
jgi:hypothetical protein